MRALLVLLCILALASPAHSRKFMNCDAEKQGGLDDACDPEAYVKTLISVLVPGLIIAAIVLITCPFFFGGRFCCNCCGSKNPTDAVCCGGKPRRYPKSHILTSKGWTIFCAVLAIVGLILCLVGNAKVHTTVKDMFDAVNDSIDNVVVFPLQKVKHTMVDVGSATSRVADDYENGGFGNADFLRIDFSNSEIDNVDKQIADVKDNVHKFRKDAEDGDKKRVMIVIIFVVVCCALIVIGGVVGAVFNVRKALPYVLMFFVFLLGCVVWLLFAVHILLATLSQDLCHEVEVTVETPENSLLMKVVFDGKCPVDVSTISSATATVNKELSGAVCKVADSTVCSDSFEFNGQKVFDCPSTSSTDCEDYNKVKQLPNEVKLKQQVAQQAETASAANYDGCPDTSQAGWSCSISECAEDRSAGGCRGKFRSASGIMVNVVGIGSGVVDLVKYLSDRFGNCNSLIKLVFGPFLQPCRDLTSGLRLLSAGFAILGIGMVFGLVAFATGAKRWLPLSESSEDSEDPPVMGIPKNKVIAGHNEDQNTDTEAMEVAKTAA